MRFAGLIHPGILGCAPSAEVLAEWNRREGDLIATNSTGKVVAQPPEPRSVHAGSADEQVAAKIGREGARTIPVCFPLNFISNTWYRAVLNTEGTAISKISPADPKSTSLSMFPVLNSPSGTFITARVTVRFRSAGRLKWLE